MFPIKKPPIIPWMPAMATPTTAGNVNFQNRHKIFQDLISSSLTIPDPPYTAKPFFRESAVGFPILSCIGKPKFALWRAGQPDFQVPELFLLFSGEKTCSKRKR